MQAARRDVYTIQLAQANELYQTDPGRPPDRLADPDRCPPDLRDFAWGLFRRACRRDVWTLSLPAAAGGRSTRPAGSCGPTWPTARSLGR